MTDPVRLISTNLDGPSRRALEAALADEPPPLAQQQVWRAIASALPVASGLLGATTTSSASAATATKASVASAKAIGIAGVSATVAPSSGLAVLAAKAVVIGLGIGIATTVATGVVVRGGSPEEPAVSAHVEAAASPARAVSRMGVSAASPERSASHLDVSATAIEVAASSVPSQPVPRAQMPEGATSRLSNREVTTSSPVRALASVNDTIAGESALIVKARRAISEAQLSEAQNLLLEHARRYPSGTLTQEREALEVQVLAKMGRTTEASARARDFLSRFPRSPHCEKLRPLLDGERR